MRKILAKPTGWLIAAIVIYIAIFFYLSFYKYQNYRYDLEDLAIFNNVFYNTAHSQPFWFSVHGGYSYLGDHLELSLLLLLPFYLIYQSPLTLLFLQTVLFGLCAWPLFLIARQHLRNRWTPLLISLIFLSCPFIQNVNLEEFHVAPLLLLLTLWTVYFYQRRQFRPFILFFILTLLTREDAALTLGGLALVALWEHRQSWRTDKKWWLVPGLLAVGWLGTSLAIIKMFSPDAGYRYILLYQQLLLGAAGPINFLGLIFRPNNLLTVLGFLLPLLFLPLRRPKYLLLALPTYLQIGLSDTGFSASVWSNHYQTPIMAGIFLALIDSLEQLKTTIFFWLTLVLPAQIYVSLFLGPLQAIKDSRASTALPNLTNKPFNDLVARLPLEENISASYRLLPKLSSRQNIYVNKLSFLGLRHLSTEQFSLPAETNTLIWDSNDAIEYYLHFKNRSLTIQQYQSGAERMRYLIKQRYGLSAAFDNLLLFETGHPARDWQLFTIADSLPNKNFTSQREEMGPVEFLGWQVFPDDASSMTTEITVLWWRINQSLTDDYFLEFNIFSPAGQLVWTKFYPPAWGLLPTHDWPINKYIGTTQSFFTPQNIAAWPCQISLVKITGDIEADPLNSTRLIIDKKEILGTIKLKH